MTAQETERVDTGPARTASTASAGRAYDRRVRRQRATGGRSLTRTGSPIAAALSRVPFVAVIILLLAGGIVGVLLLNTLSDTVGLRASASRFAQMGLTVEIQQDTRDILAKKDPARLAAQAKALGLVPPGDAAMLEVGQDGRGTVLGTPTAVAPPTTVTPVPTPAAVAAPSGTLAVLVPLPSLVPPTLSVPGAPTSSPGPAPTATPSAAKPTAAKPSAAKPSDTEPTATKPSGATAAATAAAARPSAATTVPATTAPATTGPATTAPPASPSPSTDVTATAGRQPPTSTGAGQ